MASLLYTKTNPKEGKFVISILPRARLITERTLISISILLGRFARDCSSIPSSSLANYIDSYMVCVSGKSSKQD